MEIVEKIQLRPTLLRMDLNQTEIFPIEYATRLRTTIYLIKLEKQLRYITKREGENIKVIRIA